MGNCNHQRSNAEAFELGQQETWTRKLSCQNLDMVNVAQTRVLEYSLRELSFQHDYGLYFRTHLGLTPLMC